MMTLFYTWFVIGVTLLTHNRGTRQGEYTDKPPFYYCGLFLAYLYNIPALLNNKVWLW